MVLQWCWWWWWFHFNSHFYSLVLFFFNIYFSLSLHKYFYRVKICFNFFVIKLMSISINTNEITSQIVHLFEMSVMNSVYKWVKANWWWKQSGKEEHLINDNKIAFHVKIGSSLKLFFCDTFTFSCSHVNKYFYVRFPLHR